MEYGDGVTFILISRYDITNNLQIILYLENKVPYDELTIELHQKVQDDLVAIPARHIKKASWAVEHQLIEPTIYQQVNSPKGMVDLLKLQPGLPMEKKIRVEDLLAEKVGGLK